jgi:flavin-binding protein dodecin
MADGLQSNMTCSSAGHVVVIAGDGAGRPQPHVSRASAQGGRMSVAKVSEISATSSKSFEDAIQQGLARAGKTLRNLRGAWIKEQHVRLDGGKVTEYQVNMMVTFVLDD